jgi:glutamine amidotransferase
MQLMADTGLEHGAHAGLGWIGGVCRPLRGGAGRIPHMGWNQAVPCTSHRVLAPLAGRSVYFAHSYVVADAPAEAVAATTEHNERFASALAKDTIVAVQFHPEKSQAAGLAVMTQFLSWRP